MRAPDDVKKALETIGYTATEMSPANEPGYTEFSRINDQGCKEFFAVSYCVEGKSVSIFEVMDEIVQKFGIPAGEK